MSDSGDGFFRILINRADSRAVTQHPISRQTCLFPKSDWNGMIFTGTTAGDPSTG